MSDELEFPDVKLDELTLSNSGIDTFMLCPRKYLYRHIMRIVANKEHEPLTFGTAFHAGLASYYSGGSDADIVKAFLLAAQEDRSQLTLSKAESKEENNTTEYSIQFGAELLLKYSKYYPRDKEIFSPVVDSDNNPYVEVGFAIDTQTGILIGKIDIICEFLSLGGIGTIDHKTSKYDFSPKYWSSFNPNNQVATYLLVVREYFNVNPSYFMVNAIRVKDYKRGDPEQTDQKLFGRGLTQRKPEQLDQRMKQIEWTIKHIKSFFQYGFDAFYMNAPQACYHMWKPCEYIPLCKAQTMGMVKEVLEGTGAYMVSPWNMLDETKNTKKQIKLTL